MLQAFLKLYSTRGHIERRRLVELNAPGRIRTYNPRVRSPMLYPIELRVLCFGDHLNLT